MNIQQIMTTLPKRRNVSQNAELTIQRCRETWKNLKNVQKNEVLSLSDVSATTIHRTYKDGHLSASVVLALAKVSDVSPLYLCGIANRVGKFTDETVDKFLVKSGFKNESQVVNTIDETNESESESDSEVIDQTVTHIDIEEDSNNHECQCDCEHEDVVLSEDEIMTILRGLFIRAKYIENDANKLASVVEILLG